MSAAETPMDRKLFDAADVLHSAAVRVLRRLRGADIGSGLSGPRLSALSVIVYRGPLSIGALADAEQVSAATISRMTKDLEYDGLIRRRSASDDRRVQLVTATEKGRRLLERGRTRRVLELAGMLQDLSPRERETVERAARILLGLAG